MEWIVQESPVSQKYSNSWNLGRDGVQKVHSDTQVMKNVCREHMGVMMSRKNAFTWTSEHPSEQEE
jgi:hypothetical protein